MTHRTLDEIEQDWQAPRQNRKDVLRLCKSHREALELLGNVDPISDGSVDVQKFYDDVAKWCKEWGLDK